VYQKKLKGKLPWYPEPKELVQEGFLMLLEMARLKPEGGKITEIPLRLLYDELT